MHTLHPCHRCRNLPLSCSCRVKTSCEHAGSGSVCARQCKAALLAPCPHQKSPPRWLDQFWDALSMQTRIRGLGTLPPLQQQALIRFPFKAKDLFHLQLLSWSHICSTVEPGSSFGTKQMYSDPVPLIPIFYLNSHLASLRYFLSSWAPISYSLQFLTLQRTWRKHLSPVLCATCCGHVSFGRTLSMACLPSISPAQSGILTVYRQFSLYQGTAWQCCSTVSASMQESWRQGGFPNHCAQLWHSLRFIASSNGSSWKGL